MVCGGAEDISRSGLPSFQPELLQDRFAERIGQFLVTRDGSREPGEGIEIDIVLGSGSFEYATEGLKLVDEGSALHAVRAISLVLARRRRAERWSLIMS